MKSVFENGGIIGTTMDFGATDSYLLSGGGGITQVGSVTSSTNTAVLSLPSGLQQGDVVIIAHIDDSTAGISNPSGWTLIQTSTVSAVNWGVWYKVMGSTPDTQVTDMTVGGTDSGAFAIAFRNVDTSVVFDVTTPTFAYDGGTGAGIPDPPAITTVTDNSLILIFGIMDDDIGTISPPSGYTDAAFLSFGGSISGCSVDIAYKTLTTAGTENPGSFSTTNNDAWVGLTIALRQQPITLGNKKNSGVWNLNAAYNYLRSIYVPPAAPASITQTALTEVSMVNSVGTFSGVSIGTADTNRIVAVAVAGGTGSSGSVSSMTIGGISATLAVQISSADVRHNSIWYAVVPSGATADIVINFSVTGLTNQLVITVAAIYDAVSTTPITNFSYNSGTGVSPSQTASITPSASSVLFGYYSAGSVTTGSTATWTNATEVVDYMPSGATAIYTAATAESLSNQLLSVTATCNDASVNRPSLVLAAWA